MSWKRTEIKARFHTIDETEVKWHFSSHRRSENETKLEWNRPEVAKAVYFGGAIEVIYL